MHRNRTGRHIAADKLTALLLTLALILQSVFCLFGGMNVSAEGGGAPKSEVWEPDDYALCVYRGSSWAVITDKTKVSLNDRIALKLHWNTLEEVSLNVPYSFSLPEGMNMWSEDRETEASVQLNVNGVNHVCNFATLATKKNSHNFTITFHPLKNEDGSLAFDSQEANAPTTNSLQSADFYVEGTMDKDNLNANEEGIVSINLPGNKNVSFQVTELMPTGPEIKKSASDIKKDDLTGTVTWTLKYKTPSKAYADKHPDETAQTLRDSLPSGVKYQESSFQIAPAVSGIGCSEDSSDPQVLTISGLENLEPAAEYTFTYKTVLTDRKIWQVMGQKNNAGAGLTNSVETANESAAGHKPLKASATAKFPGDWSGFTLLNKSGTTRKEADGTTFIDWVITVNAFSQTYKKLTVKDTMGKALTYNAGTAMVNGNPATPDTAGRELDFSLINSSAGQKSSNIYTISYSTQVDQTYFEHTGEFQEEDAGNSAVLEWEWPEGQGPGGINIPPTVVKPGDINGLDNDMIKKAPVGYNHADHKLTWKITVNPQKVSLTELKLEDDLSLANHIFAGEGGDQAAENEVRDAVKAGLQEAGISEDTLSGVSLANNKLTADFGNIGDKSFSFYLNSYAEDPADWAGNKETTYNNTIEVTEAMVNGTKVQGIPRATATQKAAVNVLKKSAVSYDPAAHETTWQLIVNESGVKLHDLTITDNLDEKLEDAKKGALSYVVSSEKLNGNPFEGENTFRVDGQQLTIFLKDISTKQIVTFKTRLNIDKEAIREEQPITVPNSVKMTSDANSGTVTADTVFKVQNNALDKKGKLKAGTQLDYSVVLNPLGIDLLGGQPSVDGLWLSDRMDAGLVPDVDSVRMYKAVISAGPNKDGLYVTAQTKGEEVTLSGENLIYNSGENSLRVRVPEEKQAYILEYSAYITRTDVKLTNHIALDGSILPKQDKLGEAGSDFTLTAFSSATWLPPADKFFTLKLTKTDSKGAAITGAVVKEAGFELYENADGTGLITRGMCASDNGICALVLPKSAAQKYNGKTLYLKEIKAPTGYAPVPNLIEVKISTAVNPQELKVANLMNGESESGRITIEITDSGEGDTPLRNAEFTVYQDPACTIPVSRQTTDDMGKCTFSGLYPGAVYYMKQTKTPEEYVLNSDIFKVTASKSPSGSDGTAGMLKVENEAADAGLMIRLFDEKNLAEILKGGSFKLYRDPEGKDPVDQEVQEDENGSLVIKGLQPQTVYYLKQTAAPGGYQISGGLIKVETGDNHTLAEIEVTNKKLPIDNMPPLRPGKPAAPEKPDTPDKPDTPGNVPGIDINRTEPVSGREKNEVSKAESPETGDTANPAIWIILMLSVLGAAAVLYYKKSKKK